MAAAAAGTGIAPFRAFLEERRVTGAKGANWLIFGNRHFHRDFLYQNDWLQYRNSGLLNRIDLAFSRDAHNAAYVQDRLDEQAEEVYRWIQQGAAIYVCGNSRIDHAVQQTLTDILAQQDDVTDAVQKLRDEAQAAGNLETTEQQRVETQGDTIVKVCMGTACHIRGAGQLVEELERQALSEATRDARRRAEAAAAALDARVGTVRTIDAAPQRVEPVPREAMLMAADARSGANGGWQPGEITIPARVTVTFDLEP